MATCVNWTSDAAAGVVRFFPLSGEKEGKEESGELGKGQLQRPTGIAVHTQKRELLVLDTTQGAILRYDLQDLSLKGRFGTIGTGNGQFNHPTDLAVNRSELPEV